MIELNISQKHKFLDGHYNRSGNLIVARKIKEYLDKN